MIQTNPIKHTMIESRLKKYCESKIHSEFIGKKINKIKIIPEYRRECSVSETEKQDKLFNYKRPTAKVEDGIGYLYVFPGKDYVDHYAKIYTKLGYLVEAKEPTKENIRQSIEKIFPKNFPKLDTVILGYVEPLVNNTNWEGDGDIKWQIQSIKGELVGFVGVKFSYWGDIIYYLSEKLSEYSNKLIYIGKLGSLDKNDEPNKVIATGNNSILNGEEIIWDNIFESEQLISQGRHITVGSVLDETSEWFNLNKNTYRFVDLEIGWIAKACQDNNIEFSYLHLVTDNLNSNYSEDLTNEREAEVLKKRYQYIGIIKSIIWNVIGHNDSLMASVLKAQQSRVDRGLLQPLERNWKSCLSFAYHTQEEAWEVVRELPRREWKDQEVIPERVLSELADTQIQLLTTLAYSGFSETDLHDAILEKLQTKRKDWK